MQKELLMDSEAITRSLTRIAHQVLETVNNHANIGIIGIQTHGVPLAEKLSETMNAIDSLSIPTGALDISFYRDDYGSKEATIRPTDISFDIKGKDIILVDDVLYTGRTIRAALDALMDLGRPKSVKLVVLVDRGCREIPIRADFVGKKMTTGAHQSIELHTMALDGEDALWLFTEEA